MLSLGANLTPFCVHSYPPSDGYAESRESVAKYYSDRVQQTVAADDVSLTSGCSHALQMAIEVLCNPGDTLLIPNPGFPLYQTIADHLGITVAKYELLPEAGWEADLQQLRAQCAAASRPRALLVNNPSNPCGSVYSREHLKGLLGVAEEFNLPIIADEIYGDMVFEDEYFEYMAALTDTVPVLSAGGLSKRFLVPGWRLGWLVAFDKGGVLERGQVKMALKQLTQIIVGPNSLMQSIVPQILERTPTEFFGSTMESLQQHAEFTCRRLGAVEGLTPVQPRGAMYVMVGLDAERFGVADDVEFAQLLLEEESVFVLPGSCFGTPNFFRIVTCPPVDVLEEAYDRMDAFCSRLVTK